MRKPNFTWWQLALAAIALSALGSLPGLQSKRKQRALYDKRLKQAPWAPPGWLFGPAWTFNNIFLLMALQRLLRTEPEEHKRLLIQQAIIWCIFFSFAYVYFNKKSPILAFVWTAADAALSTSSLLTAKSKDSRLAADYLPITLWTNFASTIALYQVLKNPDPVFGTRAFLK